MSEEARQESEAPVGHDDERRRRERDEKDEKQSGRWEHEKHDEKEEKEHRNDPLSTVLWALFLIIAGLILLAQQQGLIDWDSFGGIWNLFFLVGGGLNLLEVVLRLLLPAYRRPVIGQLIAGVVLIGIGVTGITGIRALWGFLLIGLGLAIIVGGLVRGRF